MTLFSLAAAVALSASAQSSFFTDLAKGAACMRDRDYGAENYQVPDAKAAPVATVPVRRQEEPLVKRFPQIKACEEASGALASYYFAPEVLMITDTRVFYRHATCDICEEISACEIKTGKILGSVASAHSVSCADLGPQIKAAKQLVFGCK